MIEIYGCAFYDDLMLIIAALESEGAYETGEKCLKLLAFVPVEKINSAFHAGDGTTLFYPSQKDAVRMTVNDFYKLVTNIFLMLHTLRFLNSTLTFTFLEICGQIQRIGEGYGQLTEGGRCSKSIPKEHKGSTWVTVP